MTTAQRIHHQICPLCEASCGLLIKTTDNRITSITGNPRDIHSKGHICPKGVALQDLYSDPDRILAPMVRRGGDWEEISWGEALDFAAARLHTIRTQHGPDAVGLYTGNPSAHNISSGSHTRPLAVELGTRSIYSSASIDIFPGLLVCSAMYGHQYLHPVPDLQRTDFLLMLGANPVVSNGSLMTTPDFAGERQALRNRGGRFVVIDPRRTETAKLADEHHFIVPGTDAFLLLAMVHVLFRDGLVDTGSLSKLIVGLGEVESAVASFTPSYAATVTGIAAEGIEKLTRDFAKAKTAVCYGRIGVSVQSFGTLAQWGIQLLNLLTGNIDRAGGALLSHPAVTRMVRPEMAAPPTRWHSRATGLPEFAGAFPVAALADEILSGQLRALIIFAGNPASSLPNTEKIDRALASLECLISIDIYLNETSRHAHVFFPGTSPLERSHYPGFSAVFGLRNFAKFSTPLFPPAGNVKPEWQILDGLARRLAALSGATPPPQRTPEEALEEEFRKGFHPHVTLQALLDHPEGLDLGPLMPSLATRLMTPNGRIHAAPRIILDDLQRLHTAYPRTQTSVPRLLLIGRRSVRSNNSWMHNTPRLMARRPEHHLLVHPKDLSRHNIADGDEVILHTDVAEISVVVKSSTDMMEGVVCLPHGWGHKALGMRLGVAASLPGANFNALLDDGMVDVPSAGSVVQGISVTLRRINAETAAELLG